MSGVGKWPWGTKISFFRLPTSSAKANPIGNSASSTQILIGLLDDVNNSDAARISSYLRGGTGFVPFRKLATECLQDLRIVNVLFADCPEEASTHHLGPADGMATEKSCHLVRTQMLKMLAVGAIQWVGFTPPFRPLTNDTRAPASKRMAKALVDVVSAKGMAKSPTPTQTSPLPKQTSPTQTSPVLTQTTSTPTQTESRATQTNSVSQRTVYTQTTSTLEPPAGTMTVADRMKDKCMDAQTRLGNCIPRGFHWTSLMVLLLLKFVYHFVVSLNWSWTQACVKAAEVFGIKEVNVFTLAKMHRDSDSDGLPSELPQKKRGRGSIKFKANDRIEQKYTVLKEEVLVDILEFVRNRNKNMKGMCTVRAVQAHLFKEHQTLFKYKTVWYAMSKRLGLKYKTAMKKRVVFTDARLGTADEFVVKLDEALKLQDAGEVIVVYMDESYVHTNHMPSKCWQEDDADGNHRVERSRSKGSLTIIVHAMTKDGWLCCFEGDGDNGAPLDGNPSRNRPRPAEFDSPSPCHNCEMIFRSKIARGDYHENFA